MDETNKEWKLVMFLDLVCLGSLVSSSSELDHSLSSSLFSVSPAIVLVEDQEVQVLSTQSDLQTIRPV